MRQDPQTAADPGARLALGGFLWGLCGFIVSMFASLNFLAELFLPNYLVTHQGGVQPLSIGVVASELGLLAAFLAAVAGLSRSVRGRHSASRRRLARAGMLFSCLALLPFGVALVVLTVTASYCSAQLCH
jgi:hypothetical protein